MRHLGWKGCMALVGVWLVSAQAATAQTKTKMPKIDHRPIVFVVGTGGEDARFGEKFRMAIEDVEHMDKYLRVEHVVWKRFELSKKRNYLDQPGQLDGGKAMAARILDLKRENPDLRVYIVAYSMGARVALIAAELLPPDTIERIILLAPAVGATYDLNPALRASRLGIDAFSSLEDSFLEFIEERLGTADGKREPTAGRVGFRVPKTDDELYRSRLRQFRWNESYYRFMHHGGHFGWTKRKFIHFAVLPMITGLPFLPTTTGSGSY